MDFDLDELRTMVIFAERLNFTSTARVLGLSQPAVYSRIRSLTEAVGSPLYRRAGRSLELTNVGARVARFARTLPTRIRRSWIDGRPSAKEI